jgi:uncharacterized protein YjiS (DUF1127 family)
MQEKVLSWGRFLFGMLGSLLRWSSHRSELARQRRWLMEMDDRMLKDIGLDRSDIPRLYQRKASAPTHERNQSNAADHIVRSQAISNFEERRFSSCSKGVCRPL